MQRKLFIIIMIFMLVLSCFGKDNKSDKNDAGNFMDQFKFSDFDTNINKSIIDMDKIYDGGPGKDGIPAIKQPQFVPIGKEELNDDILGIFINLGGEQRFYPYNILVWHELVNDTIAGNPVLISFCPLCGSAIVFHRRVGNDVLQFGVSGKLYESNLLMYDHKTESLWSQSRGEAVVGNYTGTKLKIINIQLFSYGELKNKYPGAMVLSRDTGYTRDYSIYPYGNYNDNDSLYFPVSNKNKQYPLKEIMVAFQFEGKPVVIALKNLTEKQKTLTVHGKEIKGDSVEGEIKITYNDREIPFYYEMWFSWYVHNHEKGIVWE